MPELPEVIAVIDAISDRLINRKIIDCNIVTKKIVKSSSPDKLEDLVKKQKIHNICNKSKYIIIKLDDYVLVIHLRMTGKLVIEHIDNFSYDKNWIRAEFLLDNNMMFRFYDMRGFGTLDIYNKDNYITTSKLNTLGPVPLNGQVSIDYLYSKTHNSKKAIKTLLLDQKIIGGLGNIYVNEVLFACKILPNRISNTLSKQDIKSIIDNSQRILNKAIKMKGTTINDFESLPGVEGSYQSELLVHLKENQPCSVCKRLILKSKVGQRGTYYCEFCQK